MNKWLAGGAAVLLIGFALWLGITRFGDARYAEGRASLASQVAAASAEAERRAADEFELGFARGQEASLGFIQWREGPLRTIREETTREIVRYGQSPAGAAVCFDADGLRTVNQGVAAAASTAFPADPGAGAAPLPRAGADPALAGWHGGPGGSQRSTGGKRTGPRRMRDDPPAAGQGVAEDRELIHAQTR
ncbi:hypothetical protein [Novosphingobium aquae]|uniref:Uncharacterized protein n=1 Tax=Novosphingobium aquae TaxID=3133435 RepID=A0ABU8S474_9SPHN